MKNTLKQEEVNFNDVMKVLQEETTPNETVKNSAPETAKKEETKTFFTYKVNKTEKIEFIQSKKSIESLLYKAPLVMRLTLASNESLKTDKVKRSTLDILAYKIQTVYQSEKTIDHTLLYAVKPNEYFMIDSSPFDLEKIDKTYYYNPEKVTLEKIEFIPIKCKTNADKELYNVLFDNKKVRDNK